MAVTKHIRVKALQEYKGPLGMFKAGEVFERSKSLVDLFERKPQHFKIIEYFDTSDVEFKPPTEGTPRLDLTQKRGTPVADIDKRMVKWTGDYNVQYEGHVIPPNTELIVTKDMAKHLLQFEGWARVLARAVKKAE
jgi:hypothetical protein